MPSTANPRGGNVRSRKARGGTRTLPHPRARHATPEDVIRDFSERLSSVPPESAATGIQRAFEPVLEFFHLDCATVWELSPQRCAFVLSQCRKGRESLCREGASSGEDLRWLSRRLLRGHCVLVCEPKRSGTAAQRARRLLGAHQAGSLLALPVRAGHVFGGVLFSSQRGDFRWGHTATSALQTITNIFAAALARRRAEREASHSESLRASILDSLPTHVAVLDRTGKVVSANRECARSSCPQRCQLSLPVGANYLASCDARGNQDRDAAASALAIRAVLEEGRPFVETDRRCRAPGPARWVRMTVTPLAVPEGGAVVTHHDITNLKQAETELAESERRFENITNQLPAQLFRAQEEERRNIARELHDDVAQRLAVLAIRLQQLEPGEQGRASATWIAELRQHAKQLSVDVSHISHLLHSAYLEHLGLGPAMASQCREIAALHRLEVECDVGELPATPDHEVALSVFRVAQEALRNVVQHSRASKVRAELSGDAKEIHLRVVDNGVGFDPASTRASEGLGLVSMRERLRLLGGSLQISSRPAAGTVLEARVPLNQPGASRVERVN